MLNAFDFHYHHFISSTIINDYKISFQ